jgi:hypothetical protein
MEGGSKMGTKTKVWENILKLGSLAVTRGPVTRIHGPPALATCDLPRGNNFGDNKASRRWWRIASSLQWRRKSGVAESAPVSQRRGKGPSYAGCVPHRGLGFFLPEVSEVATVRIAVSWVATPYSLVDLYRRFGGPSYLHFQSRIEIWGFHIGRYYDSLLGLSLYTIWWIFTDVSEAPAISTFRVE